MLKNIVNADHWQIKDTISLEFLMLLIWNRQTRTNTGMALKKKKSLHPKDTKLAKWKLLHIHDRPGDIYLSVFLFPVAELYWRKCAQETKSPFQSRRRARYGNRILQLWTSESHEWAENKGWREIKWGWKNEGEFMWGEVGRLEKQCWCP